MVIIIIILLSGLIPFLYHSETPTTPPETVTPSLGEYSSIPFNVNTVAGEPNFTRESWPFILDNYPDFTWKNPGKFNGSQTTAGDIIWTATGTVRGFQSTLPTVGTGAAKYPTIYNSISGLNESNIRIMYLDAAYNWVSVPYQIDQRGWVNVWNVADLNKWAGLSPSGAGMAGGTGGSGIFTNGGGEHQAADTTVGLGWIAGDLGNSEGMTNYGPWAGGAGANNIQVEWYRIPTWTYVSPRQADGSVSNEELVIDPEYRDNLIWCYMVNATYRPHTAWLAGDHGGVTPLTNQWNVNGYPVGLGGRNPRNEYPQYATMTRDSWRPAFVNTTDGTDPWTIPYTGATNTVFMGDTWFTTPGDYPTTAGGSTMPTWVRDAFPYQQINGAVDKDDQICFYTYNGRQAPDWLWWNYSYFPQRFELAIVDPVDGGRTWMYLYYNNNSEWNPVVSYLNPTAGKNMGAPKFTTTDEDGNPISWYVTWDPSTQAITTDFYRTTMNLTTANMVSGLQMFGNTDGVSILESFAKMYLSGHLTMSQSGQTVANLDISFGRHGLWYHWPGDGTSYPSANYNEIIATLDNPSVWYPGVTNDNSIMIPYTYGGGQVTADRRTLSYAPQCPQNYYGPEGVLRGHSPSLQTWARTTGDRRAIINGPCRIIFYYQSFMMLGFAFYCSICGTTVLDDAVEFVFPILDGPQLYYRRMLYAPETTMEIPSLAGATIQLYYAYFECGEINRAIRNDLNITAVREWAGKADGVDDGKPRFGWADQYGYTKIGGLNAKTTGYEMLGYSDFNESHNQTNYYKSGGNPLIQVNPTSYPNVVPQGTNNLNLCDWAMLTSETHGSVWLYIPRREVNESLDNNNHIGQTGKLKMYFRDDGGPQSHPGFGICLDGGASPWIQGGTATSPYRLMMVFGETKAKDALAVGHKLYVDYYHPLEAAVSISSSPAPSPRFMFSTAQPDKLVYTKGEQVNILVTGTLSTTDTYNTIIYVNSSNIHSMETIATMTNNGDGSWTYTYPIDTVSSYAAPAITRYINLTAWVDTAVPGWLLSTYLLNITIDNTAPNPAGQLLAPVSETYQASVLLDWTANPGFDQGSASMANPSGLGGYILQRGTVSGTYDTNLTGMLPITTTQFLDTFVENGKNYYYRLLTFDLVGNVAASTECTTHINLPYNPAQPAELPGTKNPTGGIVIDWSANPGSWGAGVTLSGYRVCRSTTLGGTYTDVSGLLNTTVKTYTDKGPAGGYVEATTYYWKVLTETNGDALYSAPISTRIDRIAPAGAELATPLPIYRAAEAEIIVSWSIKTLPEYQTGGFPGQDLNGISHWIISKKIGAGLWNNISSVPYSPLAENQLYRDTAVINGTTYTYRIYTVDGAGNTARCTFDKTTKLWVIGPGKAEVHSIVAGSPEVKQGATSISVTVLVRNPGTTSVDLNQVQLYIHKFNVTQEVNVTKDYTGILLDGGGALAAYANRTFVFSVNVSTTANLGTFTVDGQTLFNTTKRIIGATYPDSWIITPDAFLSIDRVTSSKSIVYPGSKDVPVTVKVNNPGKSNATIETVQLTFTQNGLDVSNKFLVERITSLPTGTFNRGSQFIVLNVTVGQSMTAGGVTVNALITGKSYGIDLADTDGAVTPLTWAVQTSAKPVIASVVADKEVYKTGSVIRLTVTCDKAGHTVRGFFGPLDGSASNETATDNGDRTYTIIHTLGTATGENTYTATVYAQNASGAVKQTLGIRLGDAPTFSGWTQTPTDGNVESNSIVDINIEINDNGGATTIQAYLKYRIEGGSWNIRVMTHASGTHWDVTIPAQNMGGYLEYMINATDTAGNWALYSKSYTVKAPYTTPYWVPGSISAHDPSNSGTIYNDVNPAPRNTPIAYTATITTIYQEDPGANYTIIVSGVDPVHHAWINITSNVWLENPNPAEVTLCLTYSTAVPSGTLITGYIYICTGLPESGGRTLAWIPFSHVVS